MAASVPSLLLDIKAHEEALAALQGSKDKSLIRHHEKKVKHLQGLYDYYNIQSIRARILEVFQEGIRTIEARGVHYKDVESLKASKAAKRSTNHFNIFIYHSPFDSSYQIVPVKFVKEATNTRRAKVEKLINLAYEQRAISKAEKKLAHVQLNNIVISLQNFIKSQSFGGEDAKLHLINVPSEKPKPLKAYPPKEVLTEFHVCGRKVIYISLAEAEENAARNNLEAYLCVYCTGYHLGHSNEKKDHRNLVSSEYASNHKTTWDRFPEKAAIFLARSSAK